MKRAFFGGVHPKGYKELSREAAIVPLHPSVVSVAMSQHIGAPCQPLVKVGDRVTVGQKIGDFSVSPLSERLSPPSSDGAKK